MVVKVRPRENYFLRVLVAFDQAANVLLGGLPDETISSRLGRNAHTWWGAAGTWILNTIQPGHTDSAILHDEERGQTVVDVEDQTEDKNG